MKPSIFKYILKKSFRDKSYLFFRIIYVVAFILILSIFVFKDNYFEKFDYDLKNNIIYRTLLVLPDKSNNSYKERFDKIESIDHVIDSYNSQYESITVKTDLGNEKFDGKVSLQYRGKSLMPNLVVGRDIEEISDEYEVICSEHFMPNTDKLDESYELKGKDLLNRSFTGSFCENVRDVNTGNINKGDCHTRKFTIVGIYDNNDDYDYNVDYNYNVCFISKKNITEMIDIEDEKMYLGIEGIGSIAAQFVTVDKRENVGYVINELKKLDMRTTLQGVIDSDMLKYIEIACNMIIALVAAVLFLISVSYIKKKVDSDSSSIGILKSYGFTSKDILLNYSLDVLCNILLSIVIGTIIFVTVLIIYNINFSGLVTYINDFIKLNFLSYCLSLIIILIIPLFLNTYYVSRKQKDKIIALLSGETDGR